MKIKNLNYIEAIQYLKNGKCKGIRRDCPEWKDNNNNYLKFEKDLNTKRGADRLVWNYTSDPVYMYDSHALANDWYLVEPEIKVTSILDCFDVYDKFIYTDQNFGNFHGQKVRITVELID